MASASSSSSYSSEEECDEIYEDQYAAQIGKSVKCKQFINNVAATRGQTAKKQGQAKQVQAQAKQQGQAKQVQSQAKQQGQVQAKQVQAKQEQVKAQQNTEREVVDDWEDLM